MSYSGSQNGGIMKDNKKGGTNGNSKTRSVRFTSGVDDSNNEKKQRRKKFSVVSGRDDDDAGNDNKGGMASSSARYREEPQYEQLRSKRPRMDRPNEYDDDDIDEWVDDEDHIGVSTKDLMNAKRSRRRKREGIKSNRDVADDDNEDEQETHIDSSTSLLMEGNRENDGTGNNDGGDVAIEPFHMKNEQNDGSGYFDGDTYVFRKRDNDDEPDAWLESLSTNDTAATANDSTSKTNNNNDNDDESSDQAEDLDDIDNDNTPDSDLYAKLIPLVGFKETIVQAIKRYGDLLKRSNNKNNSGKKKTDSKKEQNDKSTPTIASCSQEIAQKALNDLTEVTNKLLLRGDVDIYQKTRKDIMNLVPQAQQQLSASAAATTQAELLKRGSNGQKEKQQIQPTQVQWEYRGNQDNQIHGPYTTQQMISWTRAGYFIGDQAVQIRTISTIPTTSQDATKNGEEKKDSKTSVDDLLSDLMDDDDDDDDGESTKKEAYKEAEKQQKQEQLTRGEWVSSNDVDFTTYS